MRTSIVAAVLILAGMTLLATPGCRNSSSGGPSSSGTVVNGMGEGVASATVYLIPASKIDTTTILNGTVLDGEAEAYDEPLEDAADSGDPAIRTAVTGAGGQFSFGPVAGGKYFVFVRPHVNDLAHLPGGDKCRTALDAGALDGLTIKLSGRPSDAAVYLGSSTCLVCHENAVGTHKFTAHAIGIMPPADPGGLQDTSKYPGFNDGTDKFTSATAYTDPGVTVLYCEDFDSTRDSDKFKVFEGATGGGTVYLRAYLWKDATNVYKITLENVLNTTDPGSPATYDVALTYGGTVFKQRFMIKLPLVTARNGHYPILQYQFAGKNTNYDRTRKVFRDYHLDWFWNDTGSTLQLPPATATFEGNCAGCHMPGYTPRQVGGEWLASGVTDPGSNYDISGDNQPDELNVGCETCHGPGSEHAGAAAPRNIVALSRVSPSRANQVCGFCHDRQIGNGTGLVNETPLDPSNRFPRPGIRRADYLKDYTTRAGSSADEIWKDLDAVHSRTHHGQFADALKSKHFRNPYRLLVCSDCHDTHDKKHPAMLKYSIAPDSPLCQRCHEVDVTEHMKEKLGTPMSGSVTSCVKCHMTKTAQSGAGRMGITLGTPTGQPSDANIVYWENDITSHTMIVPSKYLLAGATPGDAMPNPYTNACGYCHTAASLPGLDKYDSRLCGGCHAETFNEWNASKHSELVTAVTSSTSSSRFSCFPCHVGQQFILQKVAGDGPFSGTLPYPDPRPTGCMMCHYPHYGETIADERLRMEGKVLLPEGPPSNPGAGTYVELGKGRICVYCHNSRRSDSEADAAARWVTSSSRWELTGIPHPANQGETYLGFGAVTSFTTAGLDEPTISDSLHATSDFTVPGGDRRFHACVTCHMFKGKAGEPHTWEPSIEGCARCHATDPDWVQWGGAATPSFHKPARGDYDGDGTVEDMEDEYEGLLARLIAGLTDGVGSGIGTPEVGFGYTWLGGHPYWNLGTVQATTPDPDAAKVARNVVLFEHDVPGGAFHNPAYAFQVMRASWTVLGRKLLSNNAWVPPGDEWTDYPR